MGTHDNMSLSYIVCFIASSLVLTWATSLAQSEVPHAPWRVAVEPLTTAETTTNAPSPVAALSTTARSNNCPQGVCPSSGSHGETVNCDCDGTDTNRDLFCVARIDWKTQSVFLSNDEDYVKNHFNGAGNRYLMVRYANGNIDRIDRNCVWGVCDSDCEDDCRHAFLALGPSLSSNPPTYNTSQIEAQVAKPKTETEVTQLHGSVPCPANGCMGNSMCYCDGGTNTGSTIYCMARADGTRVTIYASNEENYAKDHFTGAGNRYLMKKEDGSISRIDRNCVFGVCMDYLGDACTKLLNSF